MTPEQFRAQLEALMIRVKRLNDKINRESEWIAANPDKLDAHKERLARLKEDQAEIDVELDRLKRLQTHFLPN